ncbi:signal transduction histidine kinase [Companilactobacillus sp. RD055328]|uniref:sensor histidine kinase n=1 Tax=Companilactobacillus sp. RD055328 TaxID=2916634 RepID=UPI001FC7D3A6|nr:HAMP domain-containing sensor histidine kinase [Companilactobacillus sp. RD055328]GKQ42976.1 signal transduction histidine kinase [Companilactobacillus sp. RD055328]
MKLIYQQMLSFFVVIFTTLCILAISIQKYNEHLEYQQTWEQLESYGNSLGSMALKEDPETHEIKNVTGGFIDDLEDVLKDQSVQFAVFDANNDQTYPEDSTNTHLKPEIWKKIKKNKVVKEETDNGLQTPKFSGNNGEMTFVIVPWFRSDKLVGAVWVGSQVSSLRNNLKDMQKNLYTTILISLIVSILLSYLLAKYHISRINRLRVAAKKVAANDFDVQINVKRRDEIDDLAADFNVMVNSLKESNEEIDRQEQRRKDFMANASHEMRTPLTTINGILEGLRYDVIPEESKEKSLELMSNETNRLIRLVSENLDYEKIRTNQISLTKSTFLAITPIENIISQLETKLKDANDVIELVADDKSIEVYADYDRFVQIFFNILQNAIQFTENGTIKVSLNKIENGTMISVSDTGIGLSKDEVQNIWDRYYKADPSRKTTKGESGLGLSIVHQLVEMHQGEIEVESELGKGTSFIVKLYDQKYINKKD